MKLNVLEVVRSLDMYRQLLDTNVQISFSNSNDKETWKSCKVVFHGGIQLYKISDPFYLQFNLYTVHGQTYPIAFFSRIADTYLSARCSCSRSSYDHISKDVPAQYVYMIKLSSV